MKKISVLFICILTAAMVFTGCGDENGSNSNNNSSTAPTTGGSNTQKETGYTYSLKGTTVAMNAEMAPIVTALGEPDKYFESESCAFQGLDKVYTYGSVVVNTYPKNDVDYVYSIELKDDTVQTAEGISIGASKSDVTAKYGSPSKETDTSYIYTKGDSELAFIFDGDSVKSITYTAVTE